MNQSFHKKDLTHDMGKMSLFLLCYNLNNTQLRCALTTSDILHSSNLFLHLGAFPGFRKGCYSMK